MDFRKAFAFVFEDADWIKKTLLLGLISLIPIVGGFVLMGWALEITQRVMDGRTDSLPDLDFGEQLKRGFKGTVVLVVYGIPLWLLSIPLGFVSAMAQDNADAAIPLTLVMLCLGSLAFIYGLVMLLIVPAAMGNFMAHEEKIGAGLNLSEIRLLVYRAPMAYLIAFLGIGLADMIGQFGAIVCFVGLLFTMPYSFAINGHLFGQAYLEATRSKE